MTAPVMRRRVFLTPGRPAAPEHSEGGEVLPASPFAGIEWSIAFAAFLVYVVSITTQRVSFGTAAMSTALLTLFLERRALRFPPIVVWSVAFVAWGFVGWTVTDYPDQVMDRLQELAKVCGVILVGVNVVTTRGRLRTLLLLILVSFAIYPIRGTFLNYFSGETLGGRAIWNGIYSNPNDLAGLCLLQFAIALGVATVERRWWVRGIAIAAAVLVPIMILLTQSRGAFVALTLFGFMVGRRYVKQLRKLIWFGACVAGLLLVVPSDVWTRIGSFGGPEQVDGQRPSDAESSQEQRMEILRVARAIIAANPITGVGVGAYANAHYVFAQSPQFNSIAQGNRDTHNTYLNLIAETGFVGFACFAILVIATLREARNARRNNKDSNPALASQLFFMEAGAYAYLVAGIWGTYGELIFTYFYFAVLYATARLLNSSVIRSVPRRGRGTDAHHRGRARIYPLEASA